MVDYEGTMKPHVSGRRPRWFGSVSIERLEHATGFIQIRCPCGKFQKLSVGDEHWDRQWSRAQAEKKCPTCGRTYLIELSIRRLMGVGPCIDGRIPLIEPSD